MLQHYQSFWAAYDVPRHLYHFSPASMKKLLHIHGLNLVAVKPMWFDSFYVSLLSEKYKTGKGSLLKGAWTGLVRTIRRFSKKKSAALLSILSAVKLLLEFYLVKKRPFLPVIRKLLFFLLNAIPFSPLVLGYLFSISWFIESRSILPTTLPDWRINF